MIISSPFEWLFGKLDVTELKRIFYWGIPVFWREFGNFLFNQA